MKNIKEINTLEEMQEYLFFIMPFATRPTKTAKTIFVNPFTSSQARNIIIEALAKRILNDLQNENTPL